MPDREIKIFLSHATKDKPTFVQKLYTALNDKFDVWYDDKSLLAGESIPFGISDGAKACEWAVVVLSPDYIRNKWTKEEFEILIALEKSDRKIIIPILHKISVEEATNFYPGIAARKAISSEKPVEEIVLIIEERISGAKIARQVGDPLLNKFATVSDLFVLRDLNQQLSKCEEGVKLVKTEVARLFEIFWKRLDQVQGSLNIQRLVRNKPTGPLAIRVEGRHKVTIEIVYGNEWTNDTTDDELTIEVFTPDYNYPDPQGKRNSLNLQMVTSYFVLGPQVVWNSAFEGNDQIVTSEEIVENALSCFIEELGSYKPES
jgi:hypothetical protein